jgi:hypothetical protein
MSGGRFNASDKLNRPGRHPHWWGDHWWESDAPAERIGGRVGGLGRRETGSSSWPATVAGLASIRRKANTQGAGPWFDPGVHRAAPHHYPDGVAQAGEMWHGVAIDGPDYAELGKLFGLRGWKVERPDELSGAIRVAMREVEDGKTTILNVVLSR